MLLTVKTSYHSYPIHLVKGAIQHINNYIDTNRNIFILTDEGVPSAYIDAIQAQCRNKVTVHVVAQGEQAKSFNVYQQVIEAMMASEMDRHSLLIAIGGGVIGDLGGFVSATYMRGIAFVNIPTTTLSQIDSSIGGKVAINVGQTKNIVGSFYPPNCVIIDTDVLTTLPKRHYHNGLVEAIKAGLLRNSSLFERFEQADIDSQIADIIYEALLVKKEIVEADEFEQHERKLLNLGHTLGHAIESYYGLKDIYHGEAVAIGMLAMVENNSVKERLIKILNHLEIPTHVDFDPAKLYQYIIQDKKVNGKEVSIITLSEIGQPEIKNIPITKVKYYINRLQ